MVIEGDKKHRKYQCSTDTTTKSDTDPTLIRWNEPVGCNNTLCNSTDMHLGRCPNYSYFPDTIRTVVFNPVDEHPRKPAIFSHFHPPSSTYPLTTYYSCPWLDTTGTRKLIQKQAHSLPSLGLGHFNHLTKVGQEVAPCSSLGEESKVSADQLRRSSSFYVFRQGTLSLRESRRPSLKSASETRVEG